MRIKADVAYALSMLTCLALNEGKASSLKIAEEYGIPRDYLIQIAQGLRNAGLISSAPGKHGGYRLARPAELITMLDVEKALHDWTPRAVSGPAALIEQEVRQELDKTMQSINIYALAWDCVAKTQEDGDEKHNDVGD